MLMYLVETEVIVRADNAKAGRYLLRSLVVADDADQAQEGLLESGYLAGLLSLEGCVLGEPHGGIEDARIVGCDEHPFPPSPTRLVTYLMPGRQIVPAAYGRWIADHN
jgi:hypothetical protein